ncbi:MAG: FtsW/RodA/SpoVE family cell cycle protein [Planctomycetes bacterium]|nr:FtsW/RodA/SpoVE family cell cycle protein [Planctomycetota bacterium]
MAPRDLVLTTTLALLLLGAVVVQSAGMTVTAPGTAWGLLTHRAVLLAGAAAAALLLARLLPVSLITSKAVAILPLAGATILLVLVLIPGVGREVNGAKRWIELGPIGFQPSEIAKWTTILLVAWYASRRTLVLGRLVSGLGPILVVVGLVCGLTMLEDLGTALLIGVVAAILLLAAGARLWHLAILGLPATAAVAVAIQTEGYRMTRLQAFLDPWADPSGSGYHIIQSLKAISGGGAGGRGLGNGIQKFGYLPEDTTDFIFSIVTEELGLLGSILVVGLFLSLMWAGWRIVREQVHPQRQLIAMGIVATVTIQALVNLLVVTGLAPTKGIALPLVSSGGTGWILTAFMLGILCRLDTTPRELGARPRTETPLLRNAPA